MTRLKKIAKSNLIKMFVSGFRPDKYFFHREPAGTLIFFFLFERCCVDVDVACFTERLILL